MLLKMKTSLAGPNISLHAGDLHEFADDAEALRLIEAGFAISAEPVAQAEPAEPAEPAAPEKPAAPKEPAKTAKTAG